jgi:hypothetical protein
MAQKHVDRDPEPRFWVKILKFLEEDADPDPGPWIRDKYPGSATLSVIAGTKVVAI